MAKKTIGSMTNARGSWGAIVPVTRKTPTKVEKQRRSERKHKARGWQNDLHKLYQERWTS